MPPPADAEVSVAQLAALLVPDEDEGEDELDEQPAASKAAAARATANLYDDLTSAS